MSYLSVHKPHHVTAEGLFQSLQYGLQCRGIQSVTKEACNKLVGIATDGAAANVAGNGLKGLVEKELDWVFWMWCLAHRLELALKDALRNTSFDLLDELLLRLYYIYEKSPKKCSELESIVTHLKEAFHLDSQGSGIRPIRACGTRWVCHKLSAMKRVLCKYGAYTVHLTTLSEDSSMKPADRAKFKGYLRKWVDAKYLLGCALFINLLTPCSIFSKSMHGDELDILGALTYLLRTVKETNKLNTKPLDQWPTYAATLKKITNEDEQWVYQGQVLKKFSEAKSHFESHCQEYCTRVTARIRTRLSWSDVQLFRDIIIMLGTQGWQKIVDEHVAMSDVLKGCKQVRIHWMLSIGWWNASRFHLKELQPRRLRYVGSLRQWSHTQHSSSHCPQWSTSRYGGGYFMHQIPPSGQTFYVLQAFFSPFQCQMGSLSEPFPR